MLQTQCIHGTDSPRLPHRGARTTSPQAIEQTVEQAVGVCGSGCAAVFSIEVRNRERLAVLAEIGPHQLLHPAGAADLVHRIRMAVARTHGIQLHLLVLLPVPVCSDLTPNETQQASPAGAPLEIAVGDIITPCGVPGVETLVVLCGTIELRTLFEGRDYPLAILGPGRASGAMAVLWCAPGPAAVVALTAGHVAVLSATRAQRGRNRHVADFTRVLSISRSWCDDLGSDLTRVDTTPRSSVSSAVRLAAGPSCGAGWRWA